MSFYSRIIDLQKLNIAWERVMKNKPACGVDNVTWEMFEEDRKEQLKQLNISLVNHEYTSMPVRVVTLHKEEKIRNVAIYCMRDKVVQQSVASELMKMYDGLFSECTYAYRPGKSALTALEVITEKIQAEGFEWVLKLDIEHFFDTVCIERLMYQLRLKIKEVDTLKLIKEICSAPCISATGELAEKRKGIYQGSAVSPIFSNIYLSEFDQIMEKECDFYIRYSDDMIVLGKSRQELEEILVKATCLLEKAGLSLSQSKTVILSMEEGVDFLGYHFDKKGKTIPAKAESGLLERLENIWLSEKTKTLQDKLKKGAEILGGWEQYFREDRNIASAYEFAVVVYMTQNKKIDITTLEKHRKTFSNINPEICQYLSQFWKKMNNRQMILYEMEDFYGVANLDKGMELNNDYLDELLEFYEELLIEETEELLVNIMQSYSDSGFFNKAAIFMDKIVQFCSNNEKGNRLPIIEPLEGFVENEERECLNFSDKQIKRYMENFVGREDTYAVQGMDNNERQNYVQVMEPLTEDVLKRHFKGECTVGTYVQRNNGTSHFMVIDIDISKRCCLK